MPPFLGVLAGGAPPTSATPGMDLSLPSTLLAESADPVFVVGGDGFVLWANRAAVKVASGVGVSLDGETLTSNSARLDAVLEPSDVRALLRVSHFGAIEVRVVKPSPLPPQTAVVLDVSGGDPDAVRFLVTLKAASPDLLRAHGGDDMMAGVTHDLRNPLGAIFGYADALLDTDAGIGLSAPQRSVLARLRKTTIRAIDLVRNYQLLLQLRAVGAREPSSPIDLNEIVSSVLEETWREDSTAPRLVPELAPERLLVPAERFHVERIVSNLFGNALKYTPSSGTVRVTTFRDGGFCRLSIQNTGKPIPQEELPLLFERYRRASNSAGTAGTGLGLFIVNYIADRIGGRVTITSNPVEGTTASVSLPSWRD